MESSTQNVYPCELYLAPSTIPNAGLGIFTGVELHRGNAIGGTTRQEGDVAIPLLDLEWHNAVAEDDDVSSLFPNPFRDYVWNAHAMGMSREADDLEAITTFWPGLDAAINAYPPLSNIARALPDYNPDANGTMHRSTHPSVGSYSPYIGGRAYVQQFVPEGGELFKDYGNAWFEDRNMSIPLITDIPKAERLLTRLARQIPRSLQPDIYEIVLQIKDLWDQPNILQALPDTWHNHHNGADLVVSNYLDQNMTMQQALRQWYQPKATRSLEWLQEHGSCMDTIRTGPSTLEGAGNGAFATRSFVEGDILTTSPVLHMVNKSILDMHDIGPDPDDPRKYRQLQTIGTQLIVNYCFSHPSTSLILCPYGKGINSINHHHDHHQQVNVRIEWSEDRFLNHNASYLTKPLEEWGTSLKPKLAFNYVATQPIGPGDELFLDYGPEWERNWKRHCHEWWSSPVFTSHQAYGKKYVSATAWNRKYQHKDILWTEEELEENFTRQRRPPPFLHLRCHSGILQYHRGRFAELQWDGHWSNQNFNYEYGRPCQVLGRQRIVAPSLPSTNNNSTMNLPTNERYEYHVVVQAVTNDDTWEIQPVEKFHIPRRLLRWFDQPHTTDLHLSLAFRHFLGLPDDMVSPQWRNDNFPSHSIASSPTPPQPTHHENAMKEPRVDACSADEKEINNRHEIYGEPPTVALPAPEKLKSQQGTTATGDDVQQTDNPDLQCDLYLAPSTIPNGGLGVFAGKNFEQGDPVGSGDVVIPLHGPLALNHDSEFGDRHFWQNPFDDYVWDAKYLGIGTDFLTDGPLTVFWPGLNAAANSFAPLINLKQTRPNLDTASLIHRCFSPGAGAMSLYHEGIDKAKRFISQGSELFKNYGDNWFQDREFGKDLPIGKDYNNARTLLENFFALWQNDTNVKRCHHSTVYELIRSIAATWSKSRTLSILPQSFDDARNLMETWNGDFGNLHQPNHTHYVSWLREHGRCVDHIYPGKSTIDGAGRAAFAKRYLPKGTVLTVSPLLHVRRDKVELSLRHTVTNSSKALLLNYCYGWSESSLLLCPYSPGVNYINHDKARANVRVQWTKHGEMNHDATFLQRPPWHFDYISSPVVAIDYVIIKDIGPDEEIFLDYGEEWTSAWHHHSQNWKPQPGCKDYLSANIFQQWVAEESFLPTMAEQEEEPYPWNVRTHCHSTLIRYSFDTLTKKGVDLSNPKHVQGIFPWETDSQIEYGQLCNITDRVLSSNLGFYTYTVEISLPDSDDKLKREGVPREAIRFFDVPYSTDIHLATAFRQHIGLPREMLPLAWKDIIPGEQDY